MANNFEQECLSLKQQINKMGEIVCSTFDEGIVAFKKHDLKLAKKIIERDTKVDELEIQAHQTAVRLLTLQIDEKQTRLISTALKVITDMERIADQVADIAEILLFYKKGPMKSDMSNIMQMAEEAEYMVKGAIAAFVNEDLATASIIISHDDKVDGLFADVRDTTVSLIIKDRGLADEVVDKIMIAKYLERIADHATNIAEWAIFSKTGKLK